MVILIDYIYEEFSKLHSLGEHRINDWIITKSVWNIFGIIAAYFCIIYILGPVFMRKRKPYNLLKILIIYNIIQIIANIYIVIITIQIGWFWKYKFVCEPIDYSTTPEAMTVLNGIWYYFLIKLLDLLDTIFFVLRKKQNQITILHVYHHAGMVLLVWISLKFVQGGQATFLGYINGIVHIIMYSYYLIASLKLGKIWWKKYVTQLQILQFTLLALQHTLTILTPNCGFPKIISTLFLPHNFLMMLLFIRFYRNTYLKKNKKSTEIYANNVSNKIDENNVESSNGKIKTR